MRAELYPHPTSGSAGLTIAVEVEREGTELLLRFAVSGPIERTRLPVSASTPQRRDELWRHTCFEAFIRPSRSPAYHELNLSPSGDWAFYHFDDYRGGMRNPDVPALAVRSATTSGRFTLRASIDLATLMSPAVPWQLNLTAVIEDGSGAKSYWALAHPPAGPPDFHHPDCFVLELPPPAAE